MDGLIFNALFFMNRNKYFYLLFSIILLSCSKSNKSNNEETGTSEQTVNLSDLKEAGNGKAMMDEQPIVRSELQDYSSLPIDSMDINLGEVNEAKVYGYRKSDTLIAEGDMLFKYPTRGMKYKFGVGTSARRWPVRNSVITIPYTISNNFPYPEEIRRDIKDAFDKWENKLNIKFVKRVSEPAFIYFLPSKRTASFVGKQGNRQSIELADWAESGNIAHEIGHALGLFHEHTRSDRDGFVAIDPSCKENINYKHAFRTDFTAEDVGRYDFNSIMHYGRNDGCFTLKIRVSNPRIPGQRDSVSVGDYLTIKKLYALQ